MPQPLAPLKDFIQEVTRRLEQSSNEDFLLEQIKPLLQKLIETDAWLPASCAQPHPLFYRQYLLHCDPLERFSVVSFVWGIGQKTPIHDHKVWGLIGMLRGAESCQSYAEDDQGLVHPVGTPYRLEPGDIDVVSPHRGDVHTVANAMADRPSISIHIYGANIGAVERHVYLPDESALSNPQEAKRAFVSGYSLPTVPNLWGRSE